MALPVEPPDSGEIRVIDRPTGEAIQRALEELHNGGVVLLPAGDYQIERTLLMPSATELRGMGSAQTRLCLGAGANAHLITNTDHREGNFALRVTGLSIDGNGSRQHRPKEHGSLTFACGVYLKNVADVVLRDVDIHDVRQTGLHFNGCRGVYVADYRCEKAGWSGLSTSGTDDIQVIRTNISHCGLDVMHSGVHLDGGVGALVEARVEDCTGNAVMLDSKYSALKRVSLRVDCSLSKRGVSLSGDGVNELADVFVTGRIHRNREVGLLISNAAHVVVDDCLIDDCGDVGIQFQGRNGGRDCLISRCEVRRCATSITELHASGANYVAGLGLSPLEASQQTPEPAPRKAGRPKAVPAPAVAVAVPTDQISGPSFDGRCPSCGTSARFVKEQRAARETYRCPRCRASLRYQGQAKVLLELYGQGATSVRELAHDEGFRSQSIFEPGVLGPFREYFAALPDYQISDYWPDVPRGEDRNGVRCEDLMRLTFPDERFDLVITSDIFEHVRRPYVGFTEVARVLRPGGRHVFTIPIGYPLPERTVPRVSTNGEEDVPLQPPRYHSGPRDSRHLVYTDFGADLIPRLKDETGVETSVIRYAHAADDRGAVVTFVSAKPSSRPNL